MPRMEVFHMSRSTSLGSGKNEEGNESRQVGSSDPMPGQQMMSVEENVGAVFVQRSDAEHKWGGAYYDGVPMTLSEHGGG